MPADISWFLKNHFRTFDGVSWGMHRISSVKVAAAALNAIVFALVSDHLQPS
jgi:hypothetical protein